MSVILVHLTDAHIGEPSDTILNRSTMIVETCLYHISSSDTVIITFTGDIVFSGKKQQFDEAEKFINEIIAKFKENNICANFVIVPGNHDCNFLESDPVRDVLLHDVEKNTEGKNVQTEIVETLVRPQTEFNAFRDALCNDIESINEILCTKVFDCSKGKVRIIMINTSWKSTKNERPGTLLIPINLLQKNNLGSEESDELVVTLMHHPLGWLHPDNVSHVTQYLRQTTNILLLGHEHRMDDYLEKGKDWSFYIKKGSELQGENPEDSAFSIYKIDADDAGLTWNNITTICFAWNNKRNTYSQVNCCEEPFCKNLALEQNNFIINEKTKRMLNDIGTLVQHFQVEQVKLSDLFCWPELEQMNIYGEDKFGRLVHRDGIYELLMEKNTTLIVGESLSGKTALLKQIYSLGVKQGKCCIICNGEDFKTHVVSNIKKKVEGLFVDQYSSENLEDFRHLHNSKRILLLDDFEKIIYADERRTKLLKALSEVFGHIILTSGTDDSIATIVAESLSSEIGEITKYRIRNFGGLKRREFIQKWYELGNVGALPEREIECKVDAAVVIVNNIIGRQSKLMPSKPFYILSILQSINAAGNADISDSRFGYLYEEIVRRSLSKVTNNSTSSLNIYLAVLSNIAYMMFSNGVKAVSEEKIIMCVQEYIEEMKIPKRAIQLIEALVQSRILHINGDGFYRFRYSYLFYFFIGRYMSKKISNPDILAKVEQMSEKLYIESYANIIIFLCYFLNNDEIIDSVLVRAYYTFDTVIPFDLADPGEIIKRAYEAIEKIFAVPNVGEEKDVTDHRKRDLIVQDDHSRQTELEDKISETDYSLTTEEEERYQKEVADINSAFRIIDVLSQIIRNYPGDISGTRKEEIITEINDLSMRVVQKLIELLTTFEKQLVQIFSDEAKEKDDGLQRGELIQKVKAMFSGFVMMFAYTMVERESNAIRNFYLIPAAESAIHIKSTISLRLAVLNVKMKTLNEPPVDELILENKLLCDNKQYFASAILRLFVASYLRSNHCGYRNRDKLCKAFSLPRADMLPNQAS